MKINSKSNNFPSDIKKTKRLSDILTKSMVLIMSCCFLIAGQAYAQGTWTPLTNAAPDPNNGVMLLMSDGTVICHTTSGGNQGDGSIFDRLTPDSTGSYINGTWSQIAPMIRERFSFSSAILKDGRVYAAGGEYGTDGVQNGSHGEVYDVTTNTWTACNGPNQVISDGNCILLDDGNVLQAIVDQPYPTTIVIYNPSTNTYISGPSTLGGQNESMWLKLPDNSILFVDEGQQTSERYIPSLNQWIVDANVPVALYDSFGLECGPGFLLPDGRGFFIGSTNHTAYYTPSGNNSPGTWAAGPDVPNGRGMPDAPGAMMINGKILIACSAQPTASVEFAQPTYFYEFDYLTNTYTPVNSPAGGTSLNVISQQCNMLDLPDGTVLFGLDQDQTSNHYYVYTPGGSPLAAGKPVINDVTPITCTTYRITGIGFNGISAGAAFGDENQNDSNYPVFRLSAGGKVYYVRSFNWNSTGVQRGNAADTAFFSLPATIPNGIYSLVVVANGIASDSVSFTDSIPLLSSSNTPPAICTGTVFNYVPSSNTAGATFTWTRDSVPGISNAAITVPQTTNPNEILINTAGVPLTVNYVYTITGSSCSNLENVSVIVNPPPSAAFSALPRSSCSIPDTVSFYNASIAGDNYQWDFGDGNTDSTFDPVHIYLNAGTYSVKLTVINACGIDSLRQSGLVAISLPSQPTASSPVSISCGNTASLTATGMDTLKWYNQPIGGNLLGTGSGFITPSLNANTTYYVESEITSPSSFCPPFSNAVGSGNNYSTSNFRSEVFSVHQRCTLVSVVVVAGSIGNRTIELRDSMDNILQSRVVNIPNGTSTVTLNFPLHVGTGYQLGCGNNLTNTNLYRNSNGISFPYSDPGGFITITGNNVPDSTHYYFFYNWELQGPSCISARTPVNVVINGGPISSFTASENANVATFTNNSTASTSWLWNFGDGDTSTAQNPVHSYNAIGTYTVLLTAFNNGCNDTISQTVTIITMGINDAELSNALSIFPNPSNGSFIVSASFNTKEQMQVIVTNTIGETIYKSLPVLSNNQQFNLNLQHEPKGIYFVQLKTNKGSVVRKLVLD